MRRHLLLVVSGATFVLAFFVSYALAEHIHTAGHIEHGLGNGCCVENRVLHPFTGTVDGHRTTMFVNLKRCGNIKRKRGPASVRHLHFNWDTGTRDPRKFRSRHSAHGNNANHQLNRHTHLHHRWIPC